MKREGRASAFAFLALAMVFLGVFVFPYFVPVAHTASVSSSNDVGFSNKFGSLWAGGCACLIFAAAWFRPEWFRFRGAVPEDARRLPPALWVPLCAISVLGTAALVLVVQAAHVRYQQDAGYFINQMTSFAVYGRAPWSQIEFPYGPLLFYPPIVLQRAIGPAHIALSTCYYLTLLAEQVAGLLFLVYLADRLPMTRGWRIGVFLFGLALTCQPLLGVNYTLFRFLAPFATLLFSLRRRAPMLCALCLGVGEFLNLSISSEMGFAFGAGAVVYALLRLRRSGRAWLPSLLAPPIAAGLFLLWVGRPFLQMLELFAGGTFNLIIRPLPFILLLLAALAWLLPTTLARFLKVDVGKAEVVGALFVAGVALVPVAFGRADAPHVLFNGLSLFVLSGVTASQRTPGKQVVWAVCLAIGLATGLSTILRLGKNQLSETLHVAASRDDARGLERPVVLLLRKGRARHGTLGEISGRPAFHLEDLTRMTGTETVATPQEVGLDVEQALQRAGLYRPSYFYFMTAVLDQRAETKKIAELNEAHWALLPPKLEFTSEVQGVTLKWVHRIFPHRQIQTPYLAGDLFAKNLQQNWQPVAWVDGYRLYENRALREAPNGAKP